jgi:hypothetical protein
LVIWTSAAQVMGKRRAGSQTGSLTPDHWKLGIDLFPTSANRECDMKLESSQRELQLWFRPRLDQNWQSGVMSSQSLETPTWIVLRQFRDSNLGVPGKCAIWMQLPWGFAKNTIWGMVVASPESRPWWVLCVKVPVACPNTQGCLECELTPCGWFLDANSSLIFYSLFLV